MYSVSSATYQLHAVVKRVSPPRARARADVPHFLSRGISISVRCRVFPGVFLRVCALVDGKDKNSRILATINPTGITKDTVRTRAESADRDAAK